MLSSAPFSQMAAMALPDGGLALPPSSAPSQGRDELPLPQIIQLELENGMLYELMKIARSGARPPQLTCGKTTVSRLASATAIYFEWKEQAEIFHIVHSLWHQATDAVLYAVKFSVVLVPPSYRGAISACHRRSAHSQIRTTESYRGVGRRGSSPDTVTKLSCFT